MPVPAPSNGCDRSSCTIAISAQIPSSGSAIGANDIFGNSQAPTPRESKHAQTHNSEHPQNAGASTHPQKAPRKRPVTTIPSQPISPRSPPVSPITPPSNRFHVSLSTSIPEKITIDHCASRPTFSYPSHPDQRTNALSLKSLPLASPIVFDANPDVMAVQSAISILQIQRAKASADMVALRTAKEAALANPAEFVADLASGRIRIDGDQLFPSAKVEKEEDEGNISEGGDDGDGMNSDDNLGLEEINQEFTENGPETNISVDVSAEDAEHINSPRASRHSKIAEDAAPTKKASSSNPPWRLLPRPQSIIRLPPINWAKYGVVGDSLNKLHDEQVTAPTPSVLAVLGPGGSYGPVTASYIAGPASHPDAHDNRLVGIAAPYAPGKDRIEKEKPKGRGRKKSNAVAE